MMSRGSCTPMTAPAAAARSHRSFDANRGLMRFRKLLLVSLVSISLLAFGQSDNSAALRDATSPAAASHVVSPFDYYAGLVRAAGGIVNRDGRATVLGLRGLSVDGVHHDT